MNDINVFLKRRWSAMVASLIICICAGFGYAWSVLQTPIIAAHGWPDGQVSLTYTVTVLCSTMAPLFFGALIRRMGTRRCIILGAIATATALAATIMVINQYKAKGPLTSILLPIVALDDAVGLMVFAVSNGIARALISGSVSIMSVLVNPILEIVGSLLLGTLLGWLFSRLEQFFHSRSKRLSLTVCFVFLCTALSKLDFEFANGIDFGFSPLLVCMMCGTIFCNLCDFSEEIMYRTDRWTAPVFVLFFVLSGAELDLRVFSSVAVIGIGVVNILARSSGKILGAHYSAKAMGCQETICKYLGITLLPQAGVALGMSVTVAAEFGAEGALIRNITLFCVLIYELVGPVFTKMALTAAGEIETESKVSNRGVIPTSPSKKA